MKFENTIFLARSFVKIQAIILRRESHLFIGKTGFSIFSNL